MDRVIRHPFGDPNADPQSEEWAKFWRIRMQSRMTQLESEPSAIAIELANGCDHRAWAVLADRHGNRFPDFASFCREPEPYGLGRDPKAVIERLVRFTGRRELELLLVPPAKPGPGRGHKASTSEDREVLQCKKKGQDVLSFAAVTEQNEKFADRLRSIATRAPEPVRKLYEGGLIELTLASALGPKNPPLGFRAKSEAVAAEAARIAEERKPSTPRERRQVQREINTLIRDRLNLHQDPVRIAVSKLKKLPPKDRVKAVMQAFGVATPSELANVLLKIE